MYFDNRLSVLELRILVRYILQNRLVSSGHYLVEMMKKLMLSEDKGSEDVSLAPFVEFDMSKIGHSSIQVPLGKDHGLMLLVIPLFVGFSIEIS